MLGEDGWRESSESCPDCGCKTLIGDWWDDPPEQGGGCIGTQHKCTNDDCGWWDQR